MTNAPRRHLAVRDACPALVVTATNSAPQPVLAGYREWAAS